MFDLALSLLRARVPSPVGDLNVGTRLRPAVKNALAVQETQV